MADILVDAGPLIALLSKSDRYHSGCVRVFRQLNCPMITTLPVVTEAMHFLHIFGGPAGQGALWKLILRGDLLLEHPGPAELVRMDVMMKKYADLPMDFADASLVVAAERHSINRIFTLDRADFTAYKLHDKMSFVIVGPN